MSAVATVTRLSSIGKKVQSTLRKRVAVDAKIVIDDSILEIHNLSKYRKI